MHSKTSKKELETETIKIKQKLSQLHFSSNSVEKQPLVKLNLKFIFVTKQGKRTHKTDGQKRPFPVVRHFE